jgi:hypothetical protein
MLPRIAVRLSVARRTSLQIPWICVADGTAYSNVADAISRGSGGEIRRVLTSPDSVLADDLGCRPGPQNADRAV